ncbi:MULTISPECIES: hypothetical protein [Rhodococcus]|uniref:Uncharacterized protein n=1 Tax=Rhodococcus qingshengii JCM 15477 TaxID=1303681 RepID=A0AB38RN95_RHOSG|nr:MULTISPECIES: hypothetical protein [Rhodococcus]MDA3635259.1 hypothetical protein [Rhodococcus sp. C-2]UPU46832.1 hypothetical protein M0639_32090 [Rhodococcus qingshengii JCM 15477]
MERVRRERDVIVTELVLEVGAMSLPDLESAVDREEELSRGSPMRSMMYALPIDTLDRR